jgi:hypothetical protein
MSGTVRDKICPACLVLAPHWDATRTIEREIDLTTWLSHDLTLSRFHDLTLSRSHDKQIPQSLNHIITDFLSREVRVIKTKVLTPSQS